MLYQQYLAKKEMLESQNPQGTKNERDLWHGTTTEAINSINSFGFDRSYCGKNGRYSLHHLIEGWIDFFKRDEHGSFVFICIRIIIVSDY